MYILVNTEMINISINVWILIYFLFFFFKKDAIKSVSKEGHHLLLSLETSGKEDDAQWDVRMDWETVQRSFL